jgi:hypothetical protein
MSQPFEEFLSSLDAIGGESLIGSGFENEISANIFRPQEAMAASFAESSGPSRQRATREGEDYEQ